MDTLSGRLSSYSQSDLIVRVGRSLANWGSFSIPEKKFAWQHLAHCRKVLDVACGTGDFISMRPGQAVGIDLSRENVAFCRSKGMEVQIGNALDLPFNDQSFDGVHSAHVMFLFNPSQAARYLTELVRVVKRGGTIVISTLCDVREVFIYPEVVKPYPPQAIFRMIRHSPASDAKGGSEVANVRFKAIYFRRPPLFNFRFSCFITPQLWRVASVLNAIQYGCFLRKYWAYRGYTIVLTRTA